MGRGGKGMGGWVGGECFRDVARNYVRQKAK